MKLTHIGKRSFNINGITIHSTLAIPLNKKLTKLNGLNDERCETFITTYNQFQLFLIEEIFLVGNKVSNFIDYGLYVLIQVYNEFMSGFNVIMISDFYQVLPIRNSWIFKITNIFNTIVISYWSKYVECYKLQYM
jgi:hypothetical protein